MSLEKTFWASPVLVFLEILINMITQTVSIPEEKRTKEAMNIKAILSKPKTTALQLQKITDLLNFLCRAIVPGLAFTWRFYAKFSNPKLKQHYHLKVDSETRKDFGVWLQFLTSPEVVSWPFMDFFTNLYTTELDFYTNVSVAADKGFGCIFGNH